MNKQYTPFMFVSLLLAALLLCAGCARPAGDDPVPVAPATPGAQPSASPAETDPELEASPAVVAIYVGNQIYDVVPLKDQVITVDQGNNMINEITVTSQGVHMSDATCENHDCVKQGEITLDNYEDRILSTFIYCLPNQVTINMIVKEDPAA